MEKNPRNQEALTRMLRALDERTWLLCANIYLQNCDHLVAVFCRLKKKKKTPTTTTLLFKKSRIYLLPSNFFFFIVFDNGDVVSVVISYFNFVVILMINQACMPMTSASQVPEEKEVKWWKSAAQFWLKQEVGPIIHKNGITVHDVNEALKEICFVLYLFWSSLYLEFETLLKILVLDAWKKNARSKLKIWGKLQTLFVCLLPKVLYNTK